MTITKRIMEAIAGTAYMGNDGLRDYHKAQAVKAALRRRDPHARLSYVREALSQYRVTAWLTEDGHIRLSVQGKDVAIL